MTYLTTLWQSLREQHALAMNLTATILLIVAVLVMRFMIGRAVRRNESLPNDLRRRWMVQIRNAAMLLLLLGIVVIWAEALRVMAVSLFAIAVATVIATKELIQCFSGSVLKAAGRSFSIGDRIEIDDVRGDVIDHGALTTTILEIGPHDLTQQHTGRAIVLPNSMLLDRPLVNETFTDEYVLHVFKVPIKMDKFWQQAEQDLLTAASEQCRPYLEQARHHFQRLGKQQGLATLSVEPRVTVLIPEAERLELVVRIAVPARRKGRIEQAVLRRFVDAVIQRAAQAEQAVQNTGSTTTVPAATDRVADAA